MLNFVQGRIKIRSQEVCEPSLRNEKLDFWTNQCVLLNAVASILHRTVLLISVQIVLNAQNIHTGWCGCFVAE